MKYKAVLTWQTLESFDMKKRIQKKINLINLKRMSLINSQGMSLIEILIVIGIFAILGIITTNSVLLSLRGARKSESQQKVRENLNYTLSVIERNIRGAQSITACPNPDSLVLDYKSADNIDTSFSCLSMGVDGYVASGSARLTGNDVSITYCSLDCSQGTVNNPPVVKILLEGTSKTATGAESITVPVQTEITLRNF